MEIGFLKYRFIFCYTVLTFERNIGDTKEDIPCMNKKGIIKSI
ncbi:MAG: hypothetical protein K0R71_1621 [Bacillales bacterium]|jgi:hypothetical protein|nr:hypothetical protein [Bacillales bacterium]